MKKVNHILVLFLFSLSVLLTACTDSEIEEELLEQQSQVENLQASGNNSQQQSTGNNNNDGSKD